MVTIGEAATLLGVHPNTVRKRVKDGTYEAEKVLTKNGLTWLITRESLSNNTLTNTLTRGSRGVTGRVQDTDLAHVLTDLVRSTQELQAASTENGRRDRLLHGATEYWKAQYDYHKHISTISLASTAAFIALLGGFFGDTSGWNEPYWMRLAFIGVVFCGLLIATTSAIGAAAAAGMNLRSLREVENADGLDRLERRRPFRRYSLTTMLALALAWAILIVFVFLSVFGL
jgi:excisionase family DNA binding protein